jgi:hypothetical protein
MACCSHDHDCDSAGCGEFSLFSSVNHPRVTCLNARDTDAAPRVLRPWHERRARDEALESLDEDEPELLLHVPFTSDVKARRPCDSLLRHCCGAGCPHTGATSLLGGAPHALAACCSCGGS